MFSRKPNREKLRRDRKHSVSSSHVPGLLALMLWLSFAATAQSRCGGETSDENYIDPTRPTILESATTPKPGVLQVEYGLTSYSGRNSSGERTSPLGFRFAPNKCIRLDFDVSVFESQRETGEQRRTGVGDGGLAFKYIFRTRPEERLAVAATYSVSLPWASRERGLGSGRVNHNLQLILQRTVGKNDFVFNALYLNNGRDGRDGRLSGAQAVLAYGRELPKNFSLTNEVYAQTIDAAGGPRGIYTQSVFAYKINKRLRLDTGVRFGFGPDAPRFGVVGGLVVGVGNLFGNRN